MKRLLILLTLIVVFILPTKGRTDELRFATPSFTYNGIAADLGTFTVELKKEKGTAEYDRWTKTLTAPDKKLQVCLTGKTYKKYPVMEYAVSLTNLSDREDTGIIADFQTLDTVLSFPNSKFRTDDKGGSSGIVRLNTFRGSFCRADDFSPIEVELINGHSHIFTTPSGRSSNEVFPFIELNYNDFAKNGYLFAIGWTGAWKAQFEHKGNIALRIGMNRTNFKLLPKETILQPSITVFTREGMTRHEFKTVVHRFMIANKVPRDTKGNVIAPILAVACGGGNKTPEMMRDILQYVIDNKFPFDTYWIDAGWYGAPHEDEHYGNCGPNWSRFVGDWRINTTTHPTGDLLPIANAVHAAKMKLLLWFEPERVADGMPIYKEHPNYVNGHLFDMGNPEALKWIQNIIYGIIEKHHIDIYRQDFNMDPAGEWNGLNEKNPDRIGIAEAKHIAGMYKFLDDMRLRFPNILQENCASGGRRIDIEMITRAHTYCRSDYYIGPKPNDYAFLLGQSTSLNLLPYLPFQGCEFNCVPVGDDYAAFSIISSGTVITPSDFDRGIVGRKFSDKETQWFKKVFAIADRMKPFYMGDYYPLTNESTCDNSCWCGWQCDRPDQNDGFVIIFRRGNASEETQTFNLGHIDANADYELDFYDGVKKTVKGSDFANWQVTLPKRSLSLVFYKKK